jgi:hypothetical protein
MIFPNQAGPENRVFDVFPLEASLLSLLPPLDYPPHPARKVPMRNTLSLIIGGIALLLALIAFIPLLGWANWFIIPFAVVGLAFGVLSDKTSGRNLNLVVIAAGALRLFLGGGIL